MSRFKFFDDEIKKEETLHNKLTYRGEPNNLNYVIIQQQKTVANDQTISDTETKMLWQLENILVDNEGYQLYLNQIEHDVLKTNSQLQHLAAFAKLFNSPTSRLHLRFTKTGKLISVLNQAEILSIWQNMKENELSSLVNANSNESKLIIKAGDNDFANSVSLIGDGILYQLLFPAFYDLGNESRVDKVERDFRSNIFNEKRINLSGERIVEGAGVDEIIIKETFINEKKGNYTQEILEIYNLQYKPILIAELDYEYRVNINYKVFKNSGVLKNVECEVEERLNNNFYFRSHYSFKLKKENYG
ncbi:hypothetical protein [Pedobacter sp. KACC 23697]|uniref:Uncharacterized protein n=1 Tax=Pedobacter sp. KACC 23697 TaxID=3149230 RepID=A0AAU7K0P5_9SPHI